MRRLVAWVLLAASLAAPAGCGAESRDATPPETQPPPETSPPSSAPSPLPPPSRPMSWATAGAFVWHETDVSPEVLGEELRDNGFGWVAVLVHDGLVEDPVDDDWVARFRRASGLPVGGWGVLRTQPVEEAALADALVGRYGLDFYIADAEADYGYSGDDGPDAERFRRSQGFVAAFRKLRPTLPAGLSSYCRPDEHDIDWGAWSSAGFVFLPQAYVNDFGAAVAPEACVRAARAYFPTTAVHPTIGMYAGVRRSLRAAGYTRLLDRAGTVGFSVYLAETGMTEDQWRDLGDAIEKLGIARPT